MRTNPPITGELPDPRDLLRERATRAAGKSDAPYFAAWLLGLGADAPLRAWTLPAKGEAQAAADRLGSDDACARLVADFKAARTAERMSLDDLLR